jgi:multiple sugar transport system substrate-binding protein
VRFAAALLALGVAVTGCSSGGGTPSASPSPTPSQPTTISFVAYGPAPVLAVYKQIAADFNAAHQSTRVSVRGYATHEQAVAAVREETEKGTPPDLFEMDSDDLPGLVADKSVQPVDDLLTDRRVDFGDGFTRFSLETFSDDSALQCMPTEISPLVVYYNTRLIDLSLAAEPDRRPVTQQTGWTLDEFQRVAALARRPGTRGLYVAPDLRQVAPFVWSGGGDLVDDDDDPTTLSLSEDSSTTALNDFLDVVRDPAVSFDAAALRRKSPVERFKAGRLGMLLGYRDLLPELRAQQGLNFDVMPLPRNGGATTDARMRGVCLSAKSAHDEKAADFLTTLVSTKSAEALAATGYVMPTNVEALNSDSFVQRGQRPLHADVFQREVRHVQPLPHSRYWPQVEAAAVPVLSALFNDPVIDSLADRLSAFDEESRLIFDPSATPSPAPSETATPSATPTPTETPSG